MHHTTSPLAKDSSKKKDLEVELINAGGADKAMAALISGEVQVGFMGPEATIYVYNEGGKDLTD